MNWETTIFGLLMLLVTINAFVFYAENYTFMGLDANGNPIPFSFDGSSQTATYGLEDLENLHEETNPNLEAIVQDTPPDNIWAIASSGFASFWAVLQNLYNLTFGYARLISSLFNPLNTAVDCSTNPVQPGCVGTGLATMLNTILLIPIIIGLIYFIKFILQTVGIAK